MHKINKLIITCEHATNYLPDRYAHLVPKKILKTHEAYDIGALEVAQAIALHFYAPIYASRVSRLLVDGDGRHGNFSGFSSRLSERQKINIVETYHLPYINEVEHGIADMLRNKKALVLHLSIHSFTPIWKGKERQTGIGLLYDPAKTLEKQFCVNWQASIEDNDPCVSVRRNYPYRGNIGGLTTHLRHQFPNRYLGIEVEVNQKYFYLRYKDVWMSHWPKQIKTLLTGTLEQFLE